MLPLPPRCAGHRFRRQEHARPRLWSGAWYAAPYRHGPKARCLAVFGL